MSEYEWRPIETAPRDGTRFIGFDAARGYRARGFINAGREFEQVDDLNRPMGIGFYPTLWAPCPRTPAMSDDGVPEMVEKVARAICHPLYMKLHPLQPPEVIDQYVEMNWSNHIKQARAAIAAMRVPTEGMRAAILPALMRDSAYDQYVGPPMAAKMEALRASGVFTAMIDAALSPAGDGG